MTSRGRQFIGVGIVLLGMAAFGPHGVSASSNAASRGIPTIPRGPGWVRHPFMASREERVVHRTLRIESAPRNAEGACQGANGVRLPNTMTPALQKLYRGVVSQIVAINLNTCQVVIETGYLPRNRALEPQIIYPPSP